MHTRKINGLSFRSLVYYSSLIQSYWAFFILTSFIATGQTTHAAKDIRKWKKAVVHIEGASDSQDSSSIAMRLLREGKISRDEWFKIVNRAKYRDARFTGTAIFMKRGKRYYLLTARHVLFDQYQAERSYRDLQEQYSKDPSRYGQDYLAQQYQRILSTIFSIIFRVPTLEESKSNLTKDSKAGILFNLNAGTSSSWPYTFSAPDIDLAVISLNTMDTDLFLKDLLTHGYEPIDFRDISSELLTEGQEVMAVGFPGATSHVGSSPLTESEAMWRSRLISVPVFSFGKIAMSNSLLPVYWADLSIYPGNSGGPLISQNKLVGIVSGQGLIGVEGSTALQTRIPFAYIIQAKYLLDLIKRQDEKDKSELEYSRPGKIKN